MKGVDRVGAEEGKQSPGLGSQDQLDGQGWEPGEELPLLLLVERDRCDCCRSHRSH